MQIHSEIPSLSLPERGLINLGEAGRLPNTSVCGTGMREREREAGSIVTSASFNLMEEIDGKARMESMCLTACTCAGVSNALV